MGLALPKLALRKRLIMPGGPLGGAGNSPAPPAPSFFLGAYSDNQASSNSWLGGKGFDYVINYVNGGSWAALRSAASTIGAAAPAMMVCGVSLAVPGTTLAQVAAGSNDADYLFIAQQLALCPGTLWVRLGWEMNISTSNSYAGGHETDFIAAWIRVRGIFLGVSTRFKFMFCPLLASAGSDASLAYP